VIEHLTHSPTGDNTSRAWLEPHGEWMCVTWHADPCQGDYSVFYAQRMVRFAYAHNGDILEVFSHGPITREQMLCLTAAITTLVPKTVDFVRRDRYDTETGDESEQVTRLDGLDPHERVRHARRALGFLAVP
jgi:hypothetical protein